MAKKKTQTEPVEPQSSLVQRAQEDITALSFFECEEVKRQIVTMAAENGGELTDEQLNTLVAAQCQSPVKLQKLCNFVKLLEGKAEICKKRKDEINKVQKHAEGIIERISDRLAVWVETQGKSYHAGEYELTTKRSKSVQVVDGFDDPFYCRTKTVVEPDKKAIKEALETGEKVNGAWLLEHVNLQIK